MSGASRARLLRDGAAELVGDGGGVVDEALEEVHRRKVARLLGARQRRHGRARLLRRGACLLRGDEDLGARELRLDRGAGGGGAKEGHDDEHDEHLRAAGVILAPGLAERDLCNGSSVAPLGQARHATRAQHSPPAQHYPDIAGAVANKLHRAADDRRRQAGIARANTQRAACRAHLEDEVLARDVKVHGGPAVVARDEVADELEHDGHEREHNLQARRRQEALDELCTPHAALSAAHVLAAGRTPQHAGVRATQCAHWPCLERQGHRRARAGPHGRGRGC